MADPIDWSQLNGAQVAANAAQAARPTQLTNVNNPMVLTPFQQGQLAIQNQGVQGERMLGILNYLQQRQVQQQQYGLDVFKAQNDQANAAITNQRENAVAASNVEATQAQIQGTQADVEAKQRDNMKQNILLQAAQTGGLSGYLQTLNQVDPAKALDIQKSSVDLQNSIIGQNKSILDLQGTERDQAVQKMQAAHNLLYQVETSNDKAGTYAQVKPVLDKVAPGVFDDDYNENQVAGAFVAGLSTTAGAGKDGSGGPNPSTIAALPQNLQGATAFASGAAQPVQARAAKIAAQAQPGIAAGNVLQAIVNSHNGVPLFSSAAVSDNGVLSTGANLMSSDARDYAAAYTQRKSALQAVGIPDEDVNDLLPVKGDTPAQVKAKNERANAMLQGASTMVNPKQIGVNPTGNPTTNNNDPLGIR